MAVQWLDSVAVSRKWPDLARFRGVAQFGDDASRRRVFLWEDLFLGPREVAGSAGAKQSVDGTN